MKVYLIRHGETAGNALGQYIGSTDEPLSGNGRAQASRVPPDTSVKTVYVTPLRRTQQTAALLFPDAEQTVVPDLREMDFGAFERRSYKDMEHDADYRAWVESGCTLPCPGGEDMAGFASRIGKAFIKVLEANAGKDTLTFLVHGGTVMAVFSLFAEEQRKYYEWNVRNLEGWAADAERTPDGSWRLVGIQKIQRQ